MNWFPSKFRRAKTRESAQKRRRELLRGIQGFERLEDRYALAVTASFVPRVGLLTVTGDALDNSITISRNAAGTLLVNGGAVQVKGGTPTIANVKQISVFGLNGNDTITLSEANGALPKAQLFGGSGNDTLVGGSGADQIFGQGGNDTLLGKGGLDSLFGGANDDVLMGGDANDQSFGESGNDRMVWNPGDDTDLNEGGLGTDTVEVNGGNGAEVFTTTANGTRVRFDRIDPAPFSIDIGTSENLVLNANGGDDSFSATGNLATLIQITVDGGAGNDTLLGSNGSDSLLGGDGNDFLDGNQGTDTVFLGAGDDVFQWDPGDGNDTVEGQAGNDSMIFNGSAIGEIFEIAANGSRVRFTRNIASIVMDLDDVENITLNALGGPDTATLGDMSGTDLVGLSINLAGTFGGTTGDAQPDVVNVLGTNGNDTIEVIGSGTSVSVIGLQTVVQVTNLEPADGLNVDGLGGNDTLTASTLLGGIVKLALNGGQGADTLLGSRGADLLIGGDGNDFVDGQQGDDLAQLGAGDDVFQWDPGDGNDTVEGQDGVDKMLFNGAGIGENIDIFANGSRVLFTRNIANITMDLNDVETIDFNGFGGADAIVVGDLTGTDLVNIHLDLSGVPGTGVGDSQPDTVVVNGTSGNDTIIVNGSTAGVNITGLAAAVHIVGNEGDQDGLTINGQAGDDTIDASGLEAGAINLTENGGLGVDTIFGSLGDDFVTGGDGNDVAFLGDGDDTFVWNPGDDNDTVEGQDGVDSLVFNGANIAEEIDISANGSRLRFFRNIANVTMDVDGTEQINFNALGGADLIVVNDLSGTAVTEVNLNLGAFGGGGDGQADNVIVKGTSGDDVALILGDSTGVEVHGLATQINILNSEAANDRLTIHALAGDDVVEASSLSAGVIGFTASGGDGNDILVGSDGDDALAGDADDDVLVGGPGLDILDGGTGDNVVLQD